MPGRFSNTPFRGEALVGGPSVQATLPLAKPCRYFWRCAVSCGSYDADDGLRSGPHATARSTSASFCCAVLRSAPLVPWSGIV